VWRPEKTQKKNRYGEKDFDSEIAFLTCNKTAPELLPICDQLTSPKTKALVPLKSPPEQNSTTKNQSPSQGRIHVYYIKPPQGNKKIL
jgi:hypothetical protein